MKRDDRYQNQVWPVRVYRWLRHKPLAAGMWAGYSLWWLLKGAPRAHDDLLDGRSIRSVLSMTWSVCMGTAEVRMKHYYTSEELLIDFFGPDGIDVG